MMQTNKNIVGLKFLVIRLFGDVVDAVDIFWFPGIVGESKQPHSLVFSLGLCTVV